MGIESVVYRFEPAACNVAELAKFLSLRGVRDGDADDKYVLASSEHWIDLQVWATGSNVASISLRVAVTNPPSVVPILDALASDLLTRYGGRLTAPGGRVLDDQDRRAILSADFSSGRRLFSEQLGDLTLPISADQVFARLAALPDDMPTASPPSATDQG